jgi:thioredoxin reductase (NADPH)
LLRKAVRAEYQAGRDVGYLADGTKITAKACVCATGMNYRRLNLPNEEKFVGAGVYFGAGVSEAMFCARDHVYVVGGGNSAAQSALHFARFGASVTMVIRDESLKKTVSQYLVARILSSPQIEVLYRTEVVALHGDDVLTGITLRNNVTREERTVETHWLFLCLGGVPHMDWAKDVGFIRDEDGYIVTGPDLIKNGKRPENWRLDREPYYLETNVPGFFAAGDVRHNSVKRVASAVGEGAMAVTFVHRYLMEDEMTMIQ